MPSSVPKIKGTILGQAGITMWSVLTISATWKMLHLRSNVHYVGKSQVREGSFSDHVPPLLATKPSLEVAPYQDSTDGVHSRRELSVPSRTDCAVANSSNVDRNP